MPLGYLFPNGGLRKLDCLRLMLRVMVWLIRATLKLTFIERLWYNFVTSVCFWKFHLHMV